MDETLKSLNYEFLLKRADFPKASDFEELLDEFFVDSGLSVYLKATDQSKRIYLLKKEEAK